MKKVITIGICIAFALLLAALPGFAQSFKEGERYSDGNFYIHFESRDTLSFFLPRNTPIGPITVAGRGKYKVNADRTGISVRLVYGYRPPIDLSHIFTVLGNTSDGSTAFFFDYTEYGRVCYPTVNYFNRRKKLINLDADSTGYLKLNLQKEDIYGDVVKVVSCSLGQYRFLSDSIIGKKVRFIVKKGFDDLRVIFYDNPKKSASVELDMIRYTDSIHVGCDGFSPSVTLLKNY